MATSVSHRLEDDVDDVDNSTVVVNLDHNQLSTTRSTTPSNYYIQRLIVLFFAAALMCATILIYQDHFLSTKSSTITNTRETEAELLNTMRQEIYNLRTEVTNLKLSLTDLQILVQSSSFTPCRGIVCSNSTNSSPALTTTDATHFFTPLQDFNNDFQSLPHLVILLRDDILHRRSIDESLGEWKVLEFPNIANDVMIDVNVCNQKQSPLIDIQSVDSKRACVSLCAKRRCCMILQINKMGNSYECVLRSIELRSSRSVVETTFYFNICKGSKISSLDALSPTTLLNSSQKSMVIVRFTKSIIERAKLTCPPTALPFFYIIPYVEPITAIEISSLVATKDECEVACYMNVNCDIYWSVDNKNCYLKRSPPRWAPLFNAWGDLFEKCPHRDEISSFMMIGGFSLARLELRIIESLKQPGPMSLAHVTDSVLRFALSPQGLDRYLNAGCGLWDMEDNHNQPSDLRLNIVDPFILKAVYPPTCYHPSLNVEKIYPSPDHVIVLVPYGRRATVAILIHYLDRDIRLGYVKQVKFLINTSDASDLQFLRDIIEQRKEVTANEGSQARYNLPALPPMPQHHIDRIHEAYANSWKEHLPEDAYKTGWAGVGGFMGNLEDIPGVFYLKLDDDIVFIEEGAIQSMLELKQLCPSHIISGNVVQNAKFNSLHQYLGAFTYKESLDFKIGGSGYRSFDLWKVIHQRFLEVLNRPNDRQLYKNFNILEVTPGKQISIHAIGFTFTDVRDCWYTTSLGLFDEASISSKFPYMFPGRSVLVPANALFVHFGYHLKSMMVDE